MMTTFNSWIAKQCVSEGHVKTICQPAVKTSTMNESILCDYCVGNSPMKQEVKMVGLIGNIGTWELILILLVAVIVVGPSKLPDVARSVGKAVGELRRATSGVKREFEEAILLNDPPKSKDYSQPVQPDPVEDTPKDTTVNESDSQDDANKD